MTYFHAQLFAIDNEIRAMFPAERDIYISGPDHMIVTTVRALRERGAPSRLIHYGLDPKISQAG